MKLRLEILNVPEVDMGLEDATQTKLPPQPSPSGGYENIVTAIGVFSKYAFAHPVSIPTAVNTAKVIIDILTKHAYLLTLMITYEGSVFISQVISEVAAAIGITLKHTITKHEQTIGVQERTHATLKTTLIVASGEYRKH